MMVGAKAGPGMEVQAMHKGKTLCGVIVGMDETHAHIHNVATKKTVNVPWAKVMVKAIGPVCSDPIGRARPSWVPAEAASVWQAFQDAVADDPVTTQFAVVAALLHFAQSKGPEGPHETGDWSFDSEGRDCAYLQLSAVLRCGEADARGHVIGC